MKIEYPKGVNTILQRYCYLYKLEGVLLIEHNQKGIAYRNKEITEEEWIVYRDNRFKLYSRLISDELCFYRRIIKNNAKKNVSIDAFLTAIVEGN